MQGLRRRILVVDDQPPICDFVTCTLEDAGYTTASASCGRDMRSALGSSRFDLVILDAVLPDERGLDLASFVLGCGTRLLMITGDTFNMTGVVGLPSPILRKPFRGAELVEKVRSALALPVPSRYRRGPDPRPARRPNRKDLCSI